MKIKDAMRAFLAAILLIAVPAPSLAAFIEITIGTAPPPLPIYVQPDCPGANYIWTPGYWAWGSYGYYWVPGAWVYAPEPGLLWTPGYWAWNGEGYYWNSGYWATNVGYYGGVDYGYGYYGDGYDGGRWSHNEFEYNTYVTRVNTSIVHNVYSDRNVFVSRTDDRISYNGGRGGLTARPTASQLSVSRSQHFGMTSTQRGLVANASHNRTMRASINHGHPQQAALARPAQTLTGQHTAQQRPAQQRTGQQRTAQQRSPHAGGHNVSSAPHSQGNHGHSGQAAVAGRNSAAHGAPARQTNQARTAQVRGAQPHATTHNLSTGGHSHATQQYRAPQQFNAPQQRQMQPMRSMQQPFGGGGGHGGGVGGHGGGGGGHGGGGHGPGGGGAHSGRPR